MSKVGKWIRTAVTAIVGLAVLVFIVAWLSGMFKAKVDPGLTVAATEPVTGEVVAVEERLAPRWPFSALGDHFLIVLQRA